MKDKIEVLVLAEAPYAESSQIIQTISKDFGYLSFIVKSSQKITARNRIIPFTHYRFMCDYKEGKTLYSLQGRDVIQTYYKSDLKSLAFLNFIGEMLRRIHVDQTNEVFTDALCVFQEAQKNTYYKYVCFLIARLLHYAGLQAHLEDCVLCGNKKIIGFSSTKGGFVCADHACDLDLLPIENLRKIRHICMVEREKVSRLQEDFQWKDMEILVRFLEDHMDIRLRSYDFFRSC